MDHFQAAHNKAAPRPPVWQRVLVGMGLGSIPGLIATTVSSIINLGALRASNDLVFGVLPEIRRAAERRMQRAAVLETGSLWLLGIGVAGGGLLGLRSGVPGHAENVSAAASSPPGDDKPRSSGQQTVTDIHLAGKIEPVRAKGLSSAP